MTENTESADPDKDFDAWMTGLRTGNSEAQQKLFDQHFQSIARFAERKLSQTTRRVQNGEDVALSAIKSFINAIEGDRYGELNTDEDLLRLLFVITSRKAIRYNERSHAQKRGGGRVRGESIFIQGSGDGSPRHSLDEAARVDGQFDQQFDMCVEDLLAKLDDDSLKEIALMKLQGMENQEIASQLQCVERTIRRKLQLIYDCWQDQQ